MAVTAGVLVLLWVTAAGPAMAYRADVFKWMARNASDFCPAGSDLPGTAAYLIHSWNRTSCVGNLGIGNGSLANIEEEGGASRKPNETGAEEKQEVDYKDSDYMAASIASGNASPSITLFRPVPDLLAEHPRAVDDTNYMRLVGLRIGGNDTSVAVRAFG